MGPGHALDAVDEEDVVGVEDEVVNESRRVGNFGGVYDLAGQHPDAIDSHGMALGDSQATGEGEQRLGSVTGNLRKATDSSDTVGGHHLVALLHLGDLSLSLAASCVNDDDS